MYSHLLSGLDPSRDSDLTHERRKVVTGIGNLTSSLLIT